MATDFRPRTIKTLVANEENSIAGWKAMRAGGGVTYAFGRDEDSAVALGTVDTASPVTEDLGGGAGVAFGADYEVDMLDAVTGHVATAEGADVERDITHGDTPSTALGENVRVVINAQATSAETYRDVRTDALVGDGANAVFGYDFTAEVYEEAAIYVYVDDVLKTLTTHYTVDGDQVTFTAGNIPAEGEVIRIDAVSLGTPIITAARAAYAGKSAGRPNSSAGETLKVVWENSPDEDLTLTTDYTIDPDGVTITLTAAGIDKLVTGQTYRVEAEYDNDYWKVTQAIDTPVGSSVPAVFSVEVDTVAATGGGTDYTLEDGVGVTFEAGSIPTAGQEIECLLTHTNDKWLMNDTAAVTPAGSSAAGVLVVEVDGTPKTGGGVDYTAIDGTSVIFEAGSIPAAAEVVEIFGKYTNDVFTASTSPVGIDDNNSAKELILVKVDDVAKTLTTDYTVSGDDGEIVTFEAGKIPAADAVVTLFWRQLNDKFQHGGTDSGLDETVTVWVDGTKATVTTDYVVSGADVIFTAGNIPTAGQVIEFNIITANAVVVAGGIVWFDTLRMNTPVWTHIIPTSAAVVEIM